MTYTADAYIQALQLQAHPEGGFYRETYRSDHVMTVRPTINSPAGQRNVSTGIYFLLEKGNFSAFHKITSDEMWHFYAGHALEVFEITQRGELRCTRLGADPWQGDIFQHVVLADTWFAARVAGDGAFSLVGCTVAPGFDFADFSMGDRATLLACFPHHSQIILALTRS